MGKRKLPSDEVLAELFKTHKPAEIAKMYNCAPISIYRDLKRLGLSSYGRLPTGEEFKELYFQYARKELAEMYGVDVVTVDYRAKQLGIYKDERHPKIQVGLKSKCPDKETLLNLLEQYSIEEIATMYDVATSTIYDWSLDYGIRRTKLIAASKEEFLELYKKHTYSEIAEICGISVDGVYWRIRKYGLNRENYPKVTETGKVSKMLSKEKLNELLKIYSVKEIANMYKISTASIYSRIKEYDLKALSRGRKPKEKPSKDELQESLRTQSIKEIADEYNVSLGSIYSLAHQYDLEIKNHGKKRGRPRKTRLDTTEN